MARLPACRSGPAKPRRRTGVLCDGVSELREEIAARTDNVAPGYISPAQPEVSSAMAWLMEECGVCASGAQQLIAYIVAGRAVLGAVPSKTTIIAERFFDEGGGMQLILHAPFGGRINKALGAGAAQAILPRIQFRTAGRGDGQRHQHLARRATQLSACRMSSSS